MGNYPSSAGLLKVRPQAFEFAHIVIMPKNHQGIYKKQYSTKLVKYSLMVFKFHV